MGFEMYPKWVDGQIVNSADEEEALLLKLHPQLGADDTDNADDETKSAENPSADEEEATPVRRGRKPKA